ncbi:MAG: hypothetical protein ABIP30_00695 [Ferruginibacter sp.]
MLLKKISLIVTGIIFLSTQSIAQLTPEQRIEDSVIGWWSNQRFDHLKPQTEPQAKKKEVIVNKLVEWMKKTYTPVAGLGTVNRFVNKSNYGAVFAVWNVSHDKMWTEANGEFKPIAEENTPFWIGVNRTFGSYNIPFLNQPDEYYFTMEQDGYKANDQPGNPDERIHSNAYKYVTWVNEWQTVYITPNNKLPFIAVTKGELLTKAEQGLDKQWENEIKDVAAKWPGNKKAQDEALIIRKQNIEKYRNNIRTLRQRHQSTLNESAILRDMQPTMYSFTLDPDPFKIDIAESKLKHAYPVYKIDAELNAKMQTETPQWIAIAFPYGTKENGNKLYELHTALAQNFNYEYAYNYFFNPEKVKGIDYKPANETQLIARLNNYRQKNKAAISPVASKIALPPNAFFFDDFSTSNEGAAPANWFFKRYGKQAVVTSIKNQPGKWLQLGNGNPLTPSLLKKPLPENFSLEFDIITDGNFESRTGGGIRLTLNSRPANADGVENTAGNGTTATIDITSGNEANYESNYRGLLKIRINATPSLNKQNYSEGISYSYPLREFTDKKTKVHVAVKVKSGILTAFINNKQVAVSSDFKMVYGGDCVTCGFAAGTKLNAIFWDNITQDSENIKTYIGNVKMTRE